MINAGVAALRADLEATSAGLTASALSYSDSDVSARDLVVGADG